MLSFNKQICSVFAFGKLRYLVDLMLHGGNFSNRHKKTPGRTLALLEGNSVRLAAQTSEEVGVVRIPHARRLERGLLDRETVRVVARVEDVAVQEAPGVVAEVEAAANGLLLFTAEGSYFVDVFDFDVAHDLLRDCLLGLCSSCCVV